MAHTQQPHPANAEPRRNFLTKALAVAFGAIVTVVPFIPALGLFLDPLLRKTRSVGPVGKAVDSQGFIKVATLSQLEEARPVQVPVIADLQNFWNRFPNTPIGSVYLRKTESGIECVNARCPHLGCTVNFRGNENIFFCPCHDSSFNVDGQRNNEIPPRDLDSLECEVRNNDEIWVKFQNFRVGVHDKTVI